MQKSKLIVWAYGEPYLYCNVYKKHLHVINGAWDLKIEGDTGIVVKTKGIFKIDKLTELPKDADYTDYNDVLQKAKEQEYELLEWSEV